MSDTIDLDKWELEYEKFREELYQKLIGESTIDYKKKELLNF